MEIEKSIIVDDKEIYLTASINISIFPDDGADPNLIYNNAESALNHAKEKEGNNY